MKNFVFFIILSLHCLRIEGQTLQSTIVSFEGNPSVLGIDKWKDKFIISAISFIEDTIGSTFVFLESELKTLEEIEFRGFAANNGGVFVKDEKFFVFGNNNYQNEFVTLLKTVEKFNQPQKFNYNTNSKYNFTNTAILIDDHIFALTVDTYLNPERKENFLQKINLDGNEIWHKTLGENDIYTAGIDISSTENGRLLIGSIRIIGGELYTELVKLDQQGNELWTLLGIENTPPGYSSHRTIELSNKNLFNISTVDKSQDEEFFMNNWSERPPKLLFMDSTGVSIKDTLLTSDEDEPYTYSKIKKGKGDYFFIFGNQGNLDFLNGDYGWLCKMSNDGKMIWNRKYHHPELKNSGHFHNIKDILELDNGDLITIGTATKPGEHQQIWAMRVNSDGCFDDILCGDISTSTKEISLSKKKISLFPNPSNGIVRFDKNEYENIDLEFIAVSDINGKIHHVEKYKNQEYLSLEHLDKGIYFILFNFKNGVSHFEKFILY